MENKKTLLSLSRKVKLQRIKEPQPQPLRLSHPFSSSSLSLVSHLTFTPSSRLSIMSVNERAIIVNVINLATVTQPWILVLHRS